MEIRCRTCKYYRNGECEQPELGVDKEFFECWLADLFEELRRKTEKEYIRKVLNVVEDASVEQLKPKNFVPPDDEFVCKYYE